MSAGFPLPSTHSASQRRSPLVVRLADGHITACRPRGLVLLPAASTSTAPQAMTRSQQTCPHARRADSRIVNPKEKAQWPRAQ